MARTLGQPRPVRPALPKGFECCHALDGIKKIRPQGAIRVTTLQTARGGPAGKEEGGDGGEYPKPYKHNHAVGTVNQAMPGKISSGVSAATANCGKYCPRNVSNCSTPSTIASTTSPVRSWSKCPGPSSNTCA